MGCPYHSGGEGESTDNDDYEPADVEERGVERRDFMKSALMIGGASALGRAEAMFGTPDVAPDDPIGIAERQNRQHAWNAYEKWNPEHQQSIPPALHLFLHVSYLGDGEPTGEDRREAEEAFRKVEEAVEWSHEGLMFTVGYSMQYFDRFDEPLPHGLDPDSGFDKPGMLRNDTIVEETALPREDPKPEPYDAVIHLASDNVQNILAAEQALWGRKKRWNGVEFASANLSGIFGARVDGEVVEEPPTEYPSRRVGFAGHGNLESVPFDQVETGEGQEDGVYPDDIPEAASLSMGFNDQYRNSVPRETEVTMLEDQKLVEPKPPGIFAQGTIQHVSKLDIDLDRWYDHDVDGRRSRMFSPHHDDENTGTVGENLGNSNAPGDMPVRQLDSEERDLAERTEADAREAGVVGHVQKTGRARFDLKNRLTEEGEETNDQAHSDHKGDLPGHDGVQESEQIILRRDVDTTDEGVPGNHFVALMRFAPYMVYMRQAMNGIEFDSATFGLTGDDRIDHGEVDGFDHMEDNGIAGFLDTRRRGNYIVPPITLRALPPARGIDADVRVSRTEEAFVVEATHDEPALPEDVRFGRPEVVNRGGGAHPEKVYSNGNGTKAYRFDADDVDWNGEEELRLFGKTSLSRKPFVGTGRP